MEPSAHSHEKDRGKWAQRWWKKAKATMPGLRLAPAPPASPVTRGSSTKGTRTAQIPPAGTNVTLETSSHAGIALTVKEEIAITPTPSQIGISTPGSTEPSTTNEPAPNSSTLTPGKFEPLHDVGASTVVQTAQPQLWLRTKSAPIWNAALETLKRENPEMYQELEETMSCLADSCERETNELFKLDTGKPEEKAIVQRMKQYLPSLAAVRGIAMAAAGLDPHKVAPIICACVFFSIDLMYNNLSPEAKDKMRNILFESVIAINEWISFESNFPKKSHPKVKNDVKKLERSLIDLYLQALRLLCDILLSRNGSWTKRAGDKVANKILEYDTRLAKLKDYKTKWASDKKLIEDKLTSDRAIAEILNWIKHDGDPEKSLREIGIKVTSEGRYQNCARWILTRPEFQDWSKGWYPLEDRRASKRVIWINGPYGTGKTTIVYRVVSELQSLSEHCLQGEGEHNEILGDEGHPGRPMRVIPYFCTALTGESKRADYQTVIRALSRKISLLPDFTLAQQAESFHSQKNRGLEESVDILAWEDLLRGLLRDDDGATDFVFVIDALDECDSSEVPEDSERLLYFMRGLMVEFSNVQMLCSSRQHVPVQEYFDDEILYMVGALAAPAEEIQNFIHDEIASRRRQKGSIFFKAGCEDLLELLKQSLVRNANGMYEWIQIWLKITIPIYNSRDTLRQREDAKELLKAMESFSDDVNNAYEKLKAGYQRLWTLGAMKGFDELRLRLFHLVLCSFRPLEIGDFVGSLQFWIGSGKLDEGQSLKIVEGLVSNFLVKDTEDYLGFTHGSAREFVMRETLGGASGSREQTAASAMWANCHAQVARTCLNHIYSQDRATYEKTMRENTFLQYSHMFWGEHCAQLSKEDRQSLGVSKELLGWIIEGSGSTKFEDWLHAAEKFPWFSTRSLTSDSGSPVFSACDWNLVEVLEELLLADTAYNLNLSPDGGEFTPLLLASYKGHEAVVKLLLDKGADIKVTNKNGHTPLHQASLKGHAKVAQQLLDKGADINTANYNGKTPLHCASLKGHVEVVKQLLDKGADINPVDKYGQTPLYWASAMRHVEVVKQLLDNGANVNVANKYGQTPLEGASMKGHIEVVRLLSGSD